MLSSLSLFYKDFSHFYPSIYLLDIASISSFLLYLPYNLYRNYNKRYNFKSNWTQRYFILHQQKQFYQNNRFTNFGDTKYLFICILSVCLYLSIYLSIYLTPHFAIIAIILSKQVIQCSLGNSDEIQHFLFTNVS